MYHGLRSCKIDELMRSELISDITGSKNSFSSDTAASLPLAKFLFIEWSHEKRCEAMKLEGDHANRKSEPKYFKYSD